MMRAMKIAYVTLLLCAVACGKKESATPAGPSCADAIGKAVGGFPQSPGSEPIIAKLKTVMTTRCESDQWSAAARTCYATQVTDMAGMKKCRETTLTKEQNDAVMGEIRTAMTGAGGAGGGPMHGAPSAGSAGSGSSQ